MAKHRTYSTEFKHQVAHDTLRARLHALAKCHDLSGNLFRIWLAKSPIQADKLRPDRKVRGSATLNRSGRQHRTDPGSVMKALGLASAMSFFCHLT